MCSKYHGHTHYYQATMFVNYLRLFVVVVIYRCHADGSHVCSKYHGHTGYYVVNSDCRHVCSKYHGFTHYYQATMLVIVINCLRLFVVVFYCYHGDGSDGRHVYTAIHRLLCWKW